VEDHPVYSPRYATALSYAAELHARQLRKGSRAPYISHLLAVSALVWEEGGDEDQALAALLHDAVEDQGGLPVLDVIEARFGPRVASIVEACTDSVTEPKPPWRARKEDHLRRLEVAPDEAMLVVAADKLHNARSTVDDLERKGAGVWALFSVGPADVVWYYEGVLALLEHRLRGAPIVDRLADVVRRLRAIAAR
jgi:(p)ppGpp synthase/HD superfamily hydrolase